MRFGLLGTGHWARTVHGPGLVAHPGVELVGVWGRDPGRAAEVAASLGARAVATPEDLVRDVDALAVALPPDIQAALAAPAAAAGRHLLLDKPLALDPAAASAVAAAAEASGAATAVFFTARWSPGLAATWERVAAGRWTDAGVVHLADNYEQGSPYAGSAWRRQWGALWDLGPHALAALDVGLGEVEVVRAVGGPGDQVGLTARHAGGATSTMLLSLTASRGARRHAVRFAGPDGLVEVGPDPTSVGEAFTAALDALLAAASGGPVPACDAAMAARLTATLAAAEADLRRG